MYAEHSERVFGGTEHITDFEVALDSPEPRRWRSGPFKGHLVRNLRYRELTTFSEQVQRYFGVFGEEQSRRSISVRRFFSGSGSASGR